MSMGIGSLAMIVPVAYRESLDHRRLWATMKTIAQHDVIGPVTKSAIDRTPEYRLLQKDAIDRRKTILEHEGGEIMRAYFNDERKRVLRALKAGREAGPAVGAMEPVLREAYRKMWGHAANEWGTWAKKHMPLTKASGEFQDDVDQWLADNLGKKITDITESTRKSIAAQVANGIEAGESAWAIAKRIEKFYLEDIIPNRSMVIARTEVASATNWIQQRIAENTGVPMEKEWLSLKDSRVRDDHREANGQIQPLDEPFEVGEDMLMYPGDPSGSPEEIINCRCTVLHHVAEGDAPPHKSASPFQFAKQVAGVENADVITALAFMQGIYGPDDDWEVARKAIMKRVHHIRRGEIV